MNARASALAVLACISALACHPDQRLSGFSTAFPFGEQTLTFRLPFEIRIHINAPETLERARPTTLMFFALPNGNTIEQTIGKQLREGDDWHFGIQHIGAQTRRLREVVTDRNLVVVYVEAETRSLPQWRRKYRNHGTLILTILDTVRALFAPYDPSVELSAHSGGGSFLFGFLDALDFIPSYITRMSFLDSNYGYDENKRHGQKLLEWLQRDTQRFLSILAYDDRHITIGGRRVVSDSGGTYRATHRLLEWLQNKVALTIEKDSVIERYSGLAGRIDIRVHTNPDTLILHTVLVERNGFIHGMTSGTRYNASAGDFWGAPAYTQWIAP
jgi:hypothetical protein